MKSKLRNVLSLMFIKDKIRELYYSLLPDKVVIARQYYKRLGKEIDFNNPVTYNEKLQWLKLYWRNPLATKCADKYEVRNFVEEKIGSKYLNDLIAVYDSVDKINLEKLPKSFVLKGTHGSGFNIICEDKANMDWDKEFNKMRRWMWTNYYWSNREWVYKDIKPRIICEKFIKQDDDEELRDYRFFCFNGEPKFIGVDLSINDKKNTRRNLYDLNWNLIDGEISYPKEVRKEITRPSKLDEMIHLSRILSENFPHARIDFYQIEGKVIFGEITFFHQSGMGVFNPPEFGEKVGNYLILPK